MTVESKVDSELDLLKVRVADQATALQVAESYGQSLKDPQFRFNMDAIWDINSLHLTKVPISEIRALPGLLRRFNSRRGDNYRVALVTRRAADFHLLRAYTALLKLIGAFRMKVFSHEAEAIKWLKLEQSKNLKRGSS